MAYLAQDSILFHGNPAWPDGKNRSCKQLLGFKFVFVILLLCLTNPIHFMSFKKIVCVCACVVCVCVCVCVFVGVQRCTRQWSPADTL